MTNKNISPVDTGTSIIAQTEPNVNVKFGKFGRSPPEQLELFPFQNRQKPQISCIPGTSPKQRDRYRVVFGDEILGDRLAIDEALRIAKLSK